MGKAAHDAERIAKRLVPPPSQPQAKVTSKPNKDHGNLKGKIEAAPVKKRVWKVFTNVPYAKFVEYGTGRRGASSDQPGEIAAGYVHGPKPGMRAQPFLRPAVKAVQGQIKTYWTSR